MTTLHASPNEVGTHAQHHPAKRESKLRESYTDLFCAGPTRKLADESQGRSGGPTAAAATDGSVGACARVRH